VRLQQIWRRQRSANRPKPSQSAFPMPTPTRLQDKPKPCPHLNQSKSEILLNQSFLQTQPTRQSSTTLGHFVLDRHEL